MMVQTDSIRIEQLIVTGSEKEPSIIDFTDSTIICGDSESGKTMAMNCIAYVLGRNKKKRTKDERELAVVYDSGYDTVELKIRDKEGYKWILTRKIGEKWIYVQSENPAIDDGKYAVSHKTKGPKFNDLLLMCMGINDVPQLARNSNGETSTMTWNSLFRLTYLDCFRVGGFNDLIKPGSGEEPTLFLSVLLYLISGHSFCKFKYEKKSITQAKRDAQIAYISDKVAAIKSQLDKGNNLQLEGECSGVQIEDAISEYEEQLNMIGRAIDEITERGRKVYSNIRNCSEDLQKKIQMKTSFAELESQYVSDITRLENVVMGAYSLADVPSLSKCPFCSGSITIPEKSEIELDSARKEYAKTKVLLQGLREVEKEVEQEVQELQERNRYLESERQNLENELEEKRTKSSELKSAIESYKKYCHLQSDKEMLTSMLEELQADEKSINEKYKADVAELKNSKYQPNDYFPDSFVSDMTDIARNICRECNYEEADSVNFVLDSFDLEVVGYKKEDLHGQGMLSVLNSILFLSFHTYLAIHGKYRPGLLMIDTPFLGFKQKKTTWKQASIKEGLLRYIAKWNYGQIVVICQTEDIAADVRKDIGGCIYDLNTPERSGFLRDFSIDDLKNKTK